MPLGSAVIYHFIVTKVYEIRDSYKSIKRIFDLATRTELEDPLLPPDFSLLFF